MSPKQRRKGFVLNDTDSRRARRETRELEDKKVNEFAGLVKDAATP